MICGKRKVNFGSKTGWCFYNGCWFCVLSAWRHLSLECLVVISLQFRANDTAIRHILTTRAAISIYSRCTEGQWDWRHSAHIPYFSRVSPNIACGVEFQTCFYVVYVNESMVNYLPADNNLGVVRTL